MHHANGCALLKCLAGTSVVELALAITRQTGFFKFFRNFLVGYTVKRWCRDFIAKRARRHTKVGFKQLAKVHAAWNAERVQDDIYRSTIIHERHIFFRKNTSNNALVSVTTRYLVADANLAQLSDENLNLHQHASLELMTILARENLYPNDLAAACVVHAL